MGDAQGQGSVELTIFLDENHSGNHWLHAALRQAGVSFERHLDHFQRGVEDTMWLPVVARKGWTVLTSDARIRYNALERKAVEDNCLRLFYFTRNDMAGAQMGQALSRALPKMLLLCAQQEPPFVASITRAGEVAVRETFHRG